MKKLIMTSVVCALCAGVYASPIFYWGSDGGLNQSGGDVTNRFGNLVEQNTNWVVQLVDVSNDQVLYEENNGFADAAGEFYADAVDAVAWKGITVKTVIYDASTTNAASYFAEFDNQYVISWIDNPGPPSTIPDYFAGGVSQGDWQAVPEPAVAGLIGIFGGGMLVVRRFFLMG